MFEGFVMKKLIIAAALAATALTGVATSSAALAQAAPPPVSDRSVPPPPGGPLAGADRDGDGIVTRAEAAAEAERRFDGMDADRNGKIDRDERRAFRDAHRPMRPHRMPPAPSGDGMPPPPPQAGTDVPPPPPPPGEKRGHHRKERPETKSQFRDRALKMFDRTDANHDGRIDVQEREAMRLVMRARRIDGNGDVRRGPPPPPAAPDAN